MVAAGAGAHPRSRGENSSTPHMPWNSAGSSPLTRGKLHDLDVCAGDERLIPAHAGKTPSLRELLVTKRAHPRSRGENAINTKAVSDQAGSSPLTRGKRLDVFHIGVEAGLIPAHAGKTFSHTTRRGRMAAHPRSRGENAQLIREEVAEAGSSPLTRGKRLACSAAFWRVGLIPAHAGKTSRTSASPAAPKAHPRSRGENDVWLAVFTDGQGSSPLTRGKLHTSIITQAAQRLIPAHAGKTPTQTRPSRPRRAHPRSRGENVIVSVLADTKKGSSPLTRGKRQAAHSKT